MRVLEVGCGPGGNLNFIKKNYNAKRLVGADISDEMVALAKNNTSLEIYKTNGTELPFNDMELDIVFCATVLQHNTDHIMLNALIKEMSRVSNNKVVFFERVEKEIRGDELNEGRPISFYKGIMEEHGFRLNRRIPINIHASYLVSGAARKLLNSTSRKEGEPLTFISRFVQTITLPITSVIDRLINIEKDVVLMEFIRIKK